MSDQPALFVVIELDSAVICMNDGRPEICQMTSDEIKEHVRSYDVIECCADAVRDALAWIDRAAVGEWLDAHHLDEEIYVRVS